MTSRTPLFTSYMQMPQRVPRRVWMVARVCGLLCAAGLVVLALGDPPLGLALFWGVCVPLLPLLLLVAPGLWRNVCPLASVSQVPRALGWTRGRALPARVQQVAPLISAGLFVLIVPLRKIVLDHSGLALACFLLTLLALAFTGGLLVKGKSGWCSQFCPMLQLERLYGQSPLLVVRNSHCPTCVGCARNCYDANPTAAALADLASPQRHVGLSRRLIAVGLPWFTVAWFTTPYLHHITLLGVLLLYARIAAIVTGGSTLVLLIEALAPFSAYQVMLGHVAAAFTLFYWFVTPLVLAEAGLGRTPLPLLLDAASVLLAAVWLRRALPRDRAFQHLRTRRAPVPVARPL